ncbi:hypothetical protein [Prosthecobacter sp.]|uniref:hypothetical protein n=1 Tax=Prosthecobacter sp. TaxID=1965333 RepID=UPI0037851333
MSSESTDKSSDDVSVKSNFFFVAEELDEFSIGFPPNGGNVWGRRLNFRCYRGWLPTPLDTGYSKGTRFNYVEKESAVYKFTYILDCKIVYPTGTRSNMLFVYLFKNNVQVRLDSHQIFYTSSSNPTQVVGEITLTMNEADAFDMRLTQKTMINDIRIAGVSGMNQLSADRI